MIEAVIFDCFGVIIPLEGGQPRPAILQLIKQLRQKYKTGLLSNMSRAGLTDRLGQPLLDELFDATLVSGEMAYEKPEAEAYLAIAKNLDVEPAHCLMVDDRQDCVAGARSVGMSAVQYQNDTHLRYEFTKLSII